MGDSHNRTAAFDLVGLSVRAQPGDRVLLPAQLHDGDFLTGAGTKYKVLRLTPTTVTVQEVDGRGRARNDREKKLMPSSLRQMQMKRIDKLQRQDVSFDTAIGHINGRHGHPPPSVHNQDAYRSWLRNNLTSSPTAPFGELGDDELRHQDQLERHLEGILKERHIDDDWAWTPPPPIQTGQRVQEPMQLHLGDFVEYYSQVYRIVAVHHEFVRALPISATGRPAGKAREFDQQFFKDYRLTRVPATHRPDVPFQDVEQFAEQNLEVPSTVTSRSEYRDWLMGQFKNLGRSPYFGLGADEVEHQHALAKQVKRLLEQRGITPDWDR